MENPGESHDLNGPKYSEKLRWRPQRDQVLVTYIVLKSRGGIKIYYRSWSSNPGYIKKFQQKSSSHLLLVGYSPRYSFHEISIHALFSAMEKEEKKSWRFKLQQWVSVLWLLSAPLFIRYFIPSEQIPNAQLCQKHSTATVSIETTTSIFAILCSNMLV